MNRKKLALFILVLLFIVSLGYSYWRMPREKTVAQLKYAPGKASPQKKGDAFPARDNKKVHLEQLEAKVDRSGAFRRNIFRPIFHEDMKALNLPPPPPPPPAMKTPPPAPPAEPHGPNLPPPPEVPAYVKEMGSFTFLGFMKKDSKKTIFLSKNNEIFLVKKGDRIGDRYEVTNISDDALTINVLPEGNEMVIPLEENKSLTPRK